MPIAKRNEVPVRETWDLSLIYPTRAAFLADEADAAARVDRIEKTYRGQLLTAEMIVQCLDEAEILYVKMDLIGSYTGLALEVDYTDHDNEAEANRIDNRIASWRSRLSFIESEIAAAPEEVLQAAVAQAKGCKNYLKDVLRRRPHRLGAETEKTLSAFAQTFGTPYAVYNTAKLADMKFDDFKVGDRTYPLGYSLFEDNYEFEADTEARRAAFRAFYGKLKEYENVTATAYNSAVTSEKVEADLRGFDSVFEYLLFDQKVTRAMYDRQIDLITEKLAPAMRRYAKLIQKVYKLDRMTFADLKLPVDPDYDPRVTIDESEKIIRDGLKVLGPEYQAMIEEAYRDRWIDFAKNEGKCTGGFCSSPYGKNSFILLSWNDRMSDVFTLAHELGHAGHFRACNAAQSAYDTDVSTYFVEAPSTMNELLLGDALLAGSTDKRFRRYVLANIVGNTYYHNFVTHLLEAWYQREVYRKIDAGESVNAGILSRIFRENLERFWGDDVEITDGAELTWMRQPHYYMGLYSYTYSAGLTVATEAARRIREEGVPAVEDWKKVLKAGSTLDPVGLAGLAGIDITTDAPLLRTIETISGMIDEIIRLTDELEGGRAN